MSVKSKKKATKIPQDKWKWFGMAGPFIGARDCYFHLCTEVGRYVISTVGEYHPGGRPIQEIGHERTYETMVFNATRGSECKRRGCNCGQPGLELSELDLNGYKDRGSATRGHMAMCLKWARRRG